LVPSSEEAIDFQLRELMSRAVQVSVGGAADTVEAADDEGADVDVAMPDDELKAEGVAVADDEGAAVVEGVSVAEGVAQFADDEGVRVADAELGGVSVADAELIAELELEAEVVAAAEDEGVRVADAELEGVSVADAELTAELELEADESADADDEDDALEVCDAVLVKLGVGEGVGLTDGTIARFDGGEPAATASAMEKGRPTHALNAAETAVKVEV